MPESRDLIIQWDIVLKDGNTTTITLGNNRGVGCREWMRIIEPESALKEFYRKCRLPAPDTVDLVGIRTITLQELEEDDG